jgi:protein tyrosine/serine phosphatase
MRVNFIFLLVTGILTGRCDSFRQAGPICSINTVKLPMTTPNSLYMVEENAATIENINIPFEKILNMRDLATASSGRVAPGKFFRTGCVSGATPSDITKVEELGIKAWVDLRSTPEHHEDIGLYSEIYKGAQSVAYNRKLNSWEKNETTTSEEGKMRYFVSLMDESVIRKGVFDRLKKRSKLAVFGLLPLSKISRRVNKGMRGIFIRAINQGGLQLLNELAVDYSPRVIIETLKVITQETETKAVGVFCTAGKDRTGLISLLTLSVLGATDDEIVADYILSDQVYSQMNNKKAMVASLSQDNLDPNVFLRAKAPVVIDTLKHIRQTYGSVDGFLEKHGFDQTWRDRMRSNIGKK